MALHQAFLAIESQLYVGRAEERRALSELLRLSAQSPVAVYIHGPREIGKSALLRAFVRDSGRKAVTLRGAQAQEGAQAILGLLSQGLAAIGVAAESTVSGVRAGLHEAARREGLVLAVDGYDELGAAERWLREEILYHVGAGAMIALCGCSAPAQLWPGERVWRAFVRPLELAQLPAGEADELLRRLGVAQASLRAAAIAAVGGWPRCLLAGADALQSSAACGPADVAGRVIEQILHPGSRRSQWRARGSAGDELVAAAAVLPSIRRDTLRVAVGSALLDQGWELLMRIAHPGADGYEFPANLAASLAAQVQRIRPWQAERWREAVLQALLARLRAHRQLPLLPQDWGEIALLARRAPWQPALHPAAERSGGWHVRRDLTEAEGLALPGASHGDRALCEKLLKLSPDSILVLRGGAGEMLGWLATVPCTQRGGPLAEHPDWRSLPSGGGGHHSLCLILAAAGEAPQAPGAVATLVRESIPDWIAARKVYAQRGSLRGAGGEDLLPLLGFRGASERAQWLEFEAPGQPHQLLERLPAAPRLWTPPERERAAAVKDALGRLFMDDFSGTALFGYLRERDGEHADPAAYLRDALLSSDLGKPAGVGREILQLYYVDRLGGHEAVADRLGLPRATYFRLHKQALQRLGTALFA